MDPRQIIAAEQKAMKDCWTGLASSLNVEVENWNKRHGSDWEFTPYDDHLSISRQYKRFRPFRVVSATLSCELTQRTDRSEVTARYFDDEPDSLPVQTFQVEPKSDSEAVSGAAFFRDGKELKLDDVVNGILSPFLNNTDKATQGAYADVRLTSCPFPA